MTQGYPLTRIAYGIGVLPIIKDLRGAYPRVTHSWYADDAGAWVSFGNILAHFEDIQVRGTPWGYFPKPTKSILVLAPQNVTRAEELFWGIGILVVTGNHYLSSFIGNRDADTTWLDEKVQGWAGLMRTLSGVETRSQPTLYCRSHLNRSSHS